MLIMDWSSDVCSSDLPGRAGAPLEELCRMVAQELEGIAPLDERQALGDQPLELDRADLGTVMLALGATLGVLVVVEAALDQVAHALEDVDKGPTQGRAIVRHPGPSQTLIEEF